MKTKICILMVVMICFGAIESAQADFGAYIKYNFTSPSSPIVNTSITAGARAKSTCTLDNGSNGEGTFTFFIWIYDPNNKNVYYNPFGKWFAKYNEEKEFSTKITPKIVGRYTIVSEIKNYDSTLSYDKKITYFTVQEDPCATCNKPDETTSFLGCLGNELWKTTMVYHWQCVSDSCQRVNFPSENTKKKLETCTYGCDDAIDACKPAPPPPVPSCDSATCDQSDKFVRSENYCGTGEVRSHDLYDDYGCSSGQCVYLSQVWRNDKSVKACACDSATKDCVIVPPPPVPPSAVTVSVNPTSVNTGGVYTVSWTAPTNATRIILQRATNVGFSGATSEYYSASAGSVNITAGSTDGNEYVRVISDNQTTGLNTMSNAVRVIVTATPLPPTPPPPPPTPPPTTAITVTVTKPTAGTYYGNQLLVIEWNATGSVKSLVDMQFSADGGKTWRAIINGTPNDGSETWVAENTDCTDGIVKVIAYDASGKPYAGNSARFSLVHSPVYENQCYQGQVGCEGEYQWSCLFENNYWRHTYTKCAQGQVCQNAQCVVGGSVVPPEQESLSCSIEAMPEYGKQPLVVSLQSESFGNIVKREIDYGDGSGVDDITSIGDVRWSYVYSRSGDYKIKMKVYDANNASYACDTNVKVDLPDRKFFFYPVNKGTSLQGYILANTKFDLEMLPPDENFSFDLVKQNNGDDIRMSVLDPDGKIIVTGAKHLNVTSMKRGRYKLVVESGEVLDGNFVINTNYSFSKLPLFIIQSGRVVWDFTRGALAGDCELNNSACITGDLGTTVVFALVGGIVGCLVDLVTGCLPGAAVGAGSGYMVADTVQDFTQMGYNTFQAGYIFIIDGDDSNNEEAYGYASLAAMNAAFIFIPVDLLIKPFIKYGPDAVKYLKALRYTKVIAENAPEEIVSIIERGVYLSTKRFEKLEKEVYALYPSIKKMEKEIALLSEGAEKSELVAKLGRAKERIGEITSDLYFEGKGLKHLNMKGTGGLVGKKIDIFVDNVNNPTKYSLNKGPGLTLLTDLDNVYVDGKRLVVVQGTFAASKAKDIEKMNKIKNIPLSLFDQDLDAISVFSLDQLKEGHVPELKFIAAPPDNNNIVGTSDFQFELTYWGEKRKEIFRIISLGANKLVKRGDHVVITPIVSPTESQFSTRWRVFGVRQWEETSVKEIKSGSNFPATNVEISTIRSGIFSFTSFSPSLTIDIGSDWIGTVEISCIVIAVPDVDHASLTLTIVNEEVAEEKSSHGSGGCSTVNVPSKSALPNFILFASLSLVGLYFLRRR